MDSTRPIRALTRGLNALTVLNLRNGATVSEVAQEVRLPRTTVYRILETLCEAGFVYRDESDDRYRLTESVKRLSDGFEDEAWITDTATPLIRELSQEIVWPVAVATLSGFNMLVRATTDHDSPLTVDRYSPGFRFPLLTSASGRTYLAFCPAAEREGLIAALAQSSKPETRLARAVPELEKILAEVKSQGYATAATSRRVSDDLSLAVPVLVANRVFACLSARVAANAMPGKLAIERLLPKLLQCAEKIAARLATPAGGGVRSAAESV